MHMTTPAECSSRYRIVVRGECVTLLVSAIEGIEGIEVQSCQDGGTCVVASVRDDAEFWGLLDRFQDFALHIVSIDELGRGAARLRLCGIPGARCHRRGESDQLKSA